MPTAIPAYEEDPYRSELTTTVLATGRDRGRPFCVLQDTVLYPEGGGQPGDLGSVGGVEVIEVRRVDGEIRHYLASAVNEPTVKVIVDWQRRYDHMQQHTAQHLLSAIALEEFDWATTSFHLGEKRCDIELDAPAIEPESVEALEERARTAIRAAHPVRTRRISQEDFRALDLRGRGLPADHEGDVRLVEIVDMDVTTCGGTHLLSTAEIESVHIGPTEPMRGGTRVFWLAGGRVRGRLRRLEEQSAQMRRLFETSEVEIEGAATAKLEALKEATQALRRLSDDLAEARADALAAYPGRFVDAHFENRDAGFLSQVAKSLLARAPEKTAFLTASGNRGHAFLIAAGADGGVSLDEVGPGVAEVLGGRGGGPGAVFQGKTDSLDKRADAAALVGSRVPD